MNRTVRLVIAVGIALAAAAASYLLVARYLGRDQQQSAGTQPGDDRVSSPGAATIGDSTVTYSPGGRTAWKVKLDQIKLQSGGQSIAATGLREAIIYNESGKPLVRLTAQRIDGNTRTKDLQVSGSVRAVTPEGAVLDTETVKWVAAEEKLQSPGQMTMRAKDTVFTAASCDFYVGQNLVKCPGKVTMQVGNNTLIGKGLTYNMKTEDFSVVGGVQAIFNPDTVRESLSR